MCIKTSKTWVLPPRPKPGRKPNQQSEKRKQKTHRVPAPVPPTPTASISQPSLEDELRRANKENLLLKSELLKLVSDLKLLREQVGASPEPILPEMTRASLAALTHTSPVSLAVLDDYEPISRKRTHEFLELALDLEDSGLVQGEEEHDDKLLKSTRQPQLHHYSLLSRTHTNNSVVMPRQSSFFDDFDSAPSLISGSSSLVLSKHLTLNSEYEEVYGKAIDLPVKKEDDISDFIDFTFLGE